MMSDIVSNFVAQDSSQAIFVLADREDTGEDEDFAARHNESILLTWIIDHVDTPIVTCEATGRGKQPFDDTSDLHRQRVISWQNLAPKFLQDRIVRPRTTEQFLLR